MRTVVGFVLLRELLGAIWFNLCLLTPKARAITVFEIPRRCASAMAFL
jgi:hypothetical protein